MSSTKKRLFVIAILAAVIAGALTIYNANKKPSTIPKEGTYYCSDDLAGKLHLTSDHYGEIQLETGAIASTSSFDGTIGKKYTVEHSLLHGDVVVVDWLKDKKLRFKVISDQSMQVLEDCGFFEKGQMFTLKEDEV